MIAAFGKFFLNLHSNLIVKNMEGNLGKEKNSRKWF